MKKTQPEEIREWWDRRRAEDSLFRERGYIQAEIWMEGQGGYVQTWETSFPGKGNSKRAKN